jgi:hypothetical protein
LSDAIVLVIDAELFVIDICPTKVLSEKSDACILPITGETDQYNTVPLDTFVVVIVKVTEPPSTTLAVGVVIEYVVLTVPAV